MNEQTKGYTLEVVYNGERISLDKEQAVTLAQKGMNYDRMYEKYSEAVKKLDSMAGYKEKIDGLAKETGTTPENIMALLEKSIREFQVANYAENEKIPPEYAEKMMNMSKEIESLKKEKEELLPIKKREEEIADFNREYPDVNVRELDREVIDAWEKSGKPLTDVYNSYMLKKFMKMRNAKEANEHNMKASSGSVKDASVIEKVYSEEEIRNMSDEEIKRKFKILARQLAKKGDE